MTKKTQEQYIEKIQIKYNLTIDDFQLLTPYCGYNKDITIKCNRCNTAFKTNAGNLVSKKRKFFCKCYGYSINWLEKKKKFDKWKSSQKNFEILEEFKGIRVNIRVKCLLCGGVQNRSVDSLLKDDSCLICQKKCSINKTNVSFMNELLEKYCGEYELIGDYKNAFTKVFIKHIPCGKIYSTKPHNILTNKGGHCPVCSIISKGEKAIIYFLQKNNINYITQKRISSIKNMPFDFYLPDYNLLIEYQGKQHFEPVKRFGGEKAFIIRQQNDKKKKEEAQKLGYNYFEINYIDFGQIESLLAQRLSVRSSESETTAILNK